MPDDVTRIVVTDATLIINLIIAELSSLLGTIPGFSFVVTEHVVKEVSHPDQASALRSAIKKNWLQVEPITDHAEIASFDEYRKSMGDGEASCLALAVHRGWLLATDDRKRGFRRVAEQKIGRDRLINTPGVFLLAIRAGVLTVEQADTAKEILDANRFKMSFRSFRDILKGET